MKLKRLISTLIVFTLVMASMVSVSAKTVYDETTKPAASWVYTTYTTDGQVAVNAKVLNAQEGDMVSYIIYGDDKKDDANSVVEGAAIGDTGNKAAAFDTSKAAEVTEGNIVHIDQATADSNGNITFPVVKFSEDEIKNRNVKITTNNATALVPYVDYIANDKGVINTNSYTSTLTEITEAAYSRSLQYRTGTNIKEVVVYAYESDNLLTPAFTKKLDTINATAVFSAGYEYLVIDVVPKDGYVTSNFGVSTPTSGNNGKAKNLVQPNWTEVIVGNRYADDMSDGNSAVKEDSLWAEDNGAGSRLQMNITAKEATAGAPYMTIDANPIYGTFTDDNSEEVDTVTFLTTVNNISATAGIDIAVYSVGYETDDEATYIFEDLDIYQEADTKGSAIMLVNEKYDSNGNVNTNYETYAKYFDSSKYVMEAKPYYYVDGTKTYLTTTGSDGYYTVNRADADGSFNK